MTGLPEVVRAAPVPVLGGGLVDDAPLDHGASTPALRAVLDAVDAATRTYASVHRGQGWLSRVTSAHYEAARAEVARFVGARADDAVVLTRNTTDAVNVLARALPEGTPVVVFDSEHHAALLPWPAATTRRLTVPRSHEEALGRLDATLASLEPGLFTPLVVVAGASNVTGELWPLERVVATARRHGARVLVDAAQLAAHRPVDLTALDADWVVLSGHKLHAPFGAGALVGRADWLDAAPPYLPGGGASAEVTADGVRWATGAARHEGGTPNVLGAVALAAACATIDRHRAAVEDHEAALTRRLLDGLRATPGVRVLSVFGDDADRGPVAAFTVDGLDSHLVATALAAEHGVAVRAGKFCAHRLVDTLLAGGGTDDATAVRASAGIATTPEHVERLLAAVATLAADGPGAEYVLEPGAGWVPVHDDRELAVDRLW
ncbi:aminotransferase class V-fold PLP-dependent enzyme [Phycicoccus sp. BSK3Z-2]|uniref:Aminotransferase class V-fold PLP-dependent enzyme n=1 Tax=Phycicoccus avicenniae TaxID=2828860 RepID=A0A941D915_9MICO|nr:aminotransferase class V-fold PLP-dependent enzyme [Phycicoccus avicenniae]